MAEPPFKPEILKAVTREAGLLSEAKKLLGDPLGADSEIVDAIKQIFRQLLRAELGIKVAAFSQDEKQEALERQIELEEDDVYHDWLPDLIELFEELCDRWPEVLDLRYGGTRSDFREFRVDYIPGLLSALQPWAGDRGYGDLEKRLREVDREYHRAIRRAAGRAENAEELDDE